MKDVAQGVIAHGGPGVTVATGLGDSESHQDGIMLARYSFGVKENHP